MGGYLGLDKRVKRMIVGAALGGYLGLDKRVTSMAVGATRVRTFPSMICSRSAHTSSAPLSSSKTMKPNPLDLCVSRLNITYKTRGVGCGGVRWGEVGAWAGGWGRGLGVAAGTVTVKIGRAHV